MILCEGGFHANGVDIDKQVMQNTFGNGAALIGSLDHQRALERNPIWAEWPDVLAACNVVPILGNIDCGKVERAAWEMLSARSPYAFCHRAGVWPLVGKDRVEAAV